MANTLTGLIPVLYEALDVVSRELVGLTGAVSKNSNAERAAKDETVRIPVTPAGTGYDITPGLYAPDDGDNALTYLDLTINKSRRYPVRWTGEEQKGLANSGQLNAITRDRFIQAMRGLVNEIEADLAALYVKASRAHGIAGTTPFGSSYLLSDLANLRKILEDNGQWADGEMSVVLDTAAGAAIRSMPNLYKANEGGGTDLLRNGTLLDLGGFMIRQSAQIKAHTKGGAAGGDIVSAGEAVGQTTLSLEGITVNTTGFKAGDIIALDTDTANKYVVTTGLVATSGDIVIGAPGLRVAAVDASELTIGNSYRANMAFRRSAIQLVTRAPAMPTGPDGRMVDMADDSILITDPLSGLTFQIGLYRQFHQIKYEVQAAWGCAVNKQEGLALLLG